nr:MAG: peptide ABC transporter substrate-binding protein [actinobacterium acMicro-1]
MRRNTRQRDAVAAALAHSAGFVSAQTLHGRLKAEGDTLGLATVYRNLASLVEDDRADVLASPEGENLYRACSSSGHHHHLICRVCGKTVEIEADAVEEWAQAVASTHGFTDAHHVVDVFGNCASCA